MEKMRNRLTETLEESVGVRERLRFGEMERSCEGLSEEVTEVSQGESLILLSSLFARRLVKSCVKTPVSAWVLCLHREVVKKEEAVLCRWKSGSLPSPRSVDFTFLDFKEMVRLRNYLEVDTLAIVGGTKDDVTTLVDSFQGWANTLSDNRTTLPPAENRSTLPSVENRCSFQPSGKGNLFLRQRTAPPFSPHPGGLVRSDFLREVGRGDVAIAEFAGFTHPFDRDEVTNLCLMDNDNLDQSNQHEKIHDSYRKLKKMFASLNNNFTTLQKVHNCVITKHSNLDSNHMSLLDEFDVLNKKHIDLTNAYEFLKSKHLEIDNSYK
ncbi:hypothetical protein M5K25_021101 [Dendrobium thyrsiflorum]|uniref:Uncharacterized protein n=1 Tax=Dendrobium thyrsiflorum TaxID=117978 RepID=A0ABD0UBL5_DENTH